MAMFYLSSALAGAFSGLLAAGIAQMDGLGGYEGKCCVKNVLREACVIVLTIMTLFVCRLEMDVSQPNQNDQLPLLTFA